MYLVKYYGMFILKRRCFAAHLSRLGNEAFLLTAIGNDELGRETAKAIDEVGLSRNFVSVIDFPTGVCQVTISDNGIPNYDLCSGRAYANAYLKGKSTDVALDHAVTLSDFVVQHLESVPEYTKELSKYLK